MTTRSSTFAIADPATPSKVSLWCSGQESAFEVINGAWRGRLVDGHIYVEDDKTPTGAGMVVWRGIVPDHIFGYNNAIRWIEGKL